MAEFDVEQMGFLNDNVINYMMTNNNELLIILLKQ